MHAETLSGLDGVSLVLADADPLRAAEVAGRLGATAAAGPDELLEDGGDAVVIATSTQGHVSLLRRAVSAGVSAFCEKPVSLELAALAEVRDEVAAAGITVQVGFQRRFDPGTARRATPWSRASWGTFCWYARRPTTRLRLRRRTSRPRAGSSGISASTTSTQSGT